MIYQLLKLERQVLYAIAAMTLLAAVGVPLAAPSARNVPMVWAMLAFMTALTACFLPRGTLFEAALPIAGRQLVVCRLAEALAMIWLPMIAGAVSLALARSTFTTPMLLAWANLPAVLSLEVLGLRCIRPAQLRNPFWVSYAVFLATILGYIWASQGLLSKLHPEFLAVGSLALSAMVFVWLWKSIPAAYEVAPIERGEAAGAATPPRPRDGLRRATRLAPWLLLLRSAFDSQVLMLLFPLALSGFAVVLGDLAPSLAWGPWIALVWFRNRALVRWLGALPIPSRAVLLSFTGPLISFYLICVCAGDAFAHIRHKAHLASGSLLAVNVAVLLGWTLLIFLLSALYEWQPLSRVPARVRQAALAIPLCGPYLMFLVLAVPGHKDRLDPLVNGALKQMAAALPANLPAASALLAIPLIAIAWTLDRVFAQTEFAVRLSSTKEQSQQLQIGRFGQ